jgi:hypothetical protein
MACNIKAQMAAHTTTTARALAPVRATVADVIDNLEQQRHRVNPDELDATLRKLRELLAGIDAAIGA